MRKYRLKSVSYFRDLGGLHTQDGKMVKSGVLYRCCDFTKINEADYKLIKDNSFATIDLRTDDEVRLKPDAFEKEDFYYHLPLLGNDENPAVTRETRNEILVRRMKQEGGMVKHIADLYRKLIRSELAKENIGKIVDILLSNKDEKMITYHCTQGKDRTGMLSVIILLALGVSKDDIVKDYLIYNRHNTVVRFWIKVGISTVLLSIKAARELNAALVARKKYIYAAFDEIEKIYGSTDNYLKEGLGITEEKINGLKKLYLVDAINK